MNRMPRSRATLVFMGVVALLCPREDVVAQGTALTASEVRADFARMTRSGGFWATSNAAYAREGSGEPAEYRMRFDLSPDGFSMSGCMWADAGPGAAAPFWRFFHAWDPTTESVLVYQVAPSGAVAIGSEGRAEAGGTESVQTLHIPGAADTRVRHLNRTVHADTLDSRSFDASGDGWVPRREYTWIWRATAERGPC